MTKLNMKFLIGTLLLLMTSFATAQTLGNKYTALDKWQFSKTLSGEWTEVSVPHSYNAVDGHSASYYRGKAYYKRNINLSSAQISKPIFILFEGAAQAAEISVNGKLIARHKGGYTPFVISLSGLLKAGENEILIACDNHEDTELIPVSSDFNKNGGLHNPVYLLEMNNI